MKRAAILAAILAAIGGLAFLVARPGAAPPAATPYVGQRGASLANSVGLGVSFQRGLEVRPLAPGTPLRGGDVLRFSVRAESPRYLLVRLRDGAAAPATIFPSPGAGAAALVRPGEALPVQPTLAPGAGKVVVTAVFADHPFSIEARGADAEEIDLVMEKEE
ncbi:MAG TPA: hypothetical protein VG319_12820 [Polyangia bacterium]|jgi:hypothetical protein|nr:hypothetical protein [Polyangia bacterium]